MSFNRSSADNEEYDDTIKQSKGPGQYNLYKSPILNIPCYAKEPTVRLQKNGVSVENRRNLTDIHSNLLGISLDSTGYEFGKNMCEAGYPVAGGVNAKCLTKKNTSILDGFNDKECFIPVESTRLSNPPCTLRGLENDRWDYLCIDPQKNLEMPFEYNTSVRLFEKDTHIPCSNVLLTSNECIGENCKDI